MVLEKVKEVLVWRWGVDVLRGVRWWDWGGGCAGRQMLGIYG